MYAFTEEDLNELLGDDLTLAATLAKLINEEGDIRTFLIGRLLIRGLSKLQEHLANEPRFMTDKEFKQATGLDRLISY